MCDRRLRQLELKQKKKERKRKGENQKKKKNKQVTSVPSIYRNVVSGLSGLLCLLRWQKHITKVECSST